MKKFKLNTKYKKILADTVTPVSVYLKLRDVFPHSLLLESSDYHANNKNFSYICCNPIASFELKNGILTIEMPNGEISSENITNETDIPQRIHDFSQKFICKSLPFKFIANGIFGYISHEAVEYFDSIEINKKKIWI